MAPSWPPRLASVTREDPTARPQPSAPGSHSSSRRPREPPRISDFELLDGSQIQVESSSSDSDLKPTRPRHGRSLSHPFPSLFSGRRKKQPDHEPGFGDSDSSDEVVQPPLARRRSSQRTMHRATGSQGSRDFVTGNCMTCGSLVRWPRDLRVYKCTICLTVNDLEPLGLKPRTGRTGSCQEGEIDAPAHLQTSASPKEPLSLAYTKRLIRQCLEVYLKTVIHQPQRGQDTGVALPDRSPLLLLPDETPPKPRESKPRPDQETGLPPFGSSPSPSTGLSSGSRPFENIALSSRENKAFHRSYSSSFPDKRPDTQTLAAQCNGTGVAARDEPPMIEAKRIFKPVEDYFISSFASTRCLARSFAPQPAATSSDMVSAAGQTQHHEASIESADHTLAVPEVDAKLLLLGDFAENGLWWTGAQEDLRTRKELQSHTTDEKPLRTDRIYPIEWEELDQWYRSIINAGEAWKQVHDEMDRPSPALSTPAQLVRIEESVLVGQEHMQRTLLKATEVLLKRPGRPILDCSDMRYLLILLANPLLSASHRTFRGVIALPSQQRRPSHADKDRARGTGPTSGQHSGIIKRLIGLLSNAPSELQNQLVKFLALYPKPRFGRLKDLVAGFLAYRLIRQNQKKHEAEVDLTGGLIPSMASNHSAATLHAALGQHSRASKASKEPPRKILYVDDWQIKAATRVLSLIFAANNNDRARRHVQAGILGQSPNIGTHGDLVHARGQLLPTSDFYTTLLDNSDLIADFEAWEQKRGKFSFCQYPFLLSIWAKIQILEYDARRQMQNKARDAFFDSIMTRRNIEQYLVLNVRRDCLVEDSLKGVSEIVGNGGEDIKKGLRIVFRGEEGIDAGGLRKEWFLLLIREVFNPDHGMFTYDDDSQYCYFNPNSFETSDQYFLVGVVVGLAIYNSTILDVALPPFAFRKLLLAAPTPVAIGQPHVRPVMNYTLDDLAEYRPRLASGLRELLEYDGDVETTFCLDFVVDIEKYGSIEQVALCPGGERKPVTNSNRREYVDLYVRYLLDSSVARQFEPFKRGFYKVCGGNALSLFRPEEIELLVRGSDEPLDIASIRSVAQYDGWKSRSQEEEEVTVQWFWQSFESASPKDQRKLLTFITGSDRIPATGASALSIRIVCLGDDIGRYPTARTCFNTLALWRYESKGRLESMLWGAVHESEGFGLK